MSSIIENLTSYIPVELVQVGNKVLLHWLQYSGEVRNGPFFKHDVAVLVEQGAARLITPLDRLDEVDDVLEPASLIFHTSRCGSTLISQSLVASRRFDAISEAIPVNRLLTLASLPERERMVYLRALLTTIARPRTAPRRPYVVKFTSWNLLFIDLIRAAYPQTPCVFVYRDPLETIHSQCREPAYWAAHSAFFEPLHRAGLLPNLAAANTLADRCAVIFEACGNAALRALSDGALWLNYRQLPDALYEVLPAFLEQSFSKEEQERIRHSTRIHAKDRSRTRLFDPEAARARIEITAPMRAADRAFSRLTYDRLEAHRTGHQQPGAAREMC